MDRKLVREVDLIRQINSELAEYPESSGCELTGVYKLREQDAEGCNRSVGFYRGGVAPIEIFRPIVERVILNFQSRYNIQVSDPVYRTGYEGAPDEPNRHLYLSFLVDTNCINARRNTPAMNQLEAWAQKDLIVLETSEVALTEMVVGDNQSRTRKAYQFIYTMSAITTSIEQRQLHEIEKFLFPDGAKTPNQRNDVEIVFNAGKYSRPLITNDGGSKSQPGGILGNRQHLARLGINVLRPEEVVELVRNAIKERDY